MCDLHNKPRCCCNCKFHIPDYWHCCTFPNRKVGECHCNEQRGWICYVYNLEGARAHSNWSEHGECGQHNFEDGV